MTSGNQPEKPNSPAVNMAFTTVGLQVGIVTIAPMLIALFLGRWLDGLLGTKPVILIVLLLGTVPLSMYLTFKVAMRTIERMNQKSSSPEQGDTISYKKEEKRSE